MPVVKIDAVDATQFPGGATYRTVVGEDDGSIPVWIGVQVSPPGYSTGTHSHPYLEVVSVLEGEGEAWMEDSDEVVPIVPGDSLVVPPGVKHWFRAVGAKPLKTYGVHASSARIVEREKAGE